MFLFGTRVFRKRSALDPAFEPHPRFLRQMLGTQIVRFAAGLDSSQPYIPKSPSKEGLQRLAGQPLPTMPGSDVTVDLSTMSLENDVREATVAYNRPCLL